MDYETSLPLTGIRVVALEQAVAAPFCSRQLADMGADVIKVERPDGGDMARGYDGALNGVSAYFAWLNRGKRSIVLDLKQPRDLDAFSRLVARADVFIHNLVPGAVERLGFGYEQLRGAHPRLIWCALSGYGPDGPYREKKAYDMLVQAEAGVVSLTGSPEAPAKVGISIADIASGLYGLLLHPGRVDPSRQHGLRRAYRYLHAGMSRGMDDAAILRLARHGEDSRARGRAAQYDRALWRLCVLGWRGDVRDSEPARVAESVRGGAGDAWAGGRSALPVE